MNQSNLSPISSLPDKYDRPRESDGSSSHENEPQVLRQKLEIALNAAQLILWEWDVESTTLMASPSFFRLHGIQGQAQCLDLHQFIQRIHPDDREWVHCQVRRSLETGEPFLCEYRVVHSFESVTWVLLSGRLLKTEEKHTRLSGVARDITDSKRGEQALRNALQIRDDFLNLAAHELKTPLTTLILQLHMFSKAASRGTIQNLPPEKIKKMVDTCSQQVNDLDGLINDMLDATRISSGKLGLLPDKTDLRNLIYTCIDRFQLSNEHRKQPISVKASHQVIGSWDRPRLQQVLNILINHAEKYGSGQGIEISLTSLEDRARVVVKDECGVPPPEQDQYQITEHPSAAGLGLSLYLCRQIILAHGGSFHACGHTHKSLLFTIELPLISLTADSLRESKSVESPLPGTALAM